MCSASATSRTSLPSASWTAVARQTDAISRSRPANAGLVLGVVIDEAGDTLLGELEALVGDAVRGELLRHQELLGDAELVGAGVARHLDDLHPVMESAGGMPSRLLAVARNITCERSKGRSR